MTKNYHLKTIFYRLHAFRSIFGAGNLIFPVHLGQEAGAATFWANLGFLVTGIGLPFLGVIAIGVSKSSGVYELAKRINQTYAMVLPSCFTSYRTVLLYLALQPHLSRLV